MRCKSTRNQHFALEAKAKVTNQATLVDSSHSELELELELCAPPAVTVTVTVELVTTAKTGRELRKAAAKQGDVRMHKMRPQTRPSRPQPSLSPYQQTADNPLTFVRCLRRQWPQPSVT